MSDDDKLGLLLLHEGGDMVKTHLDSDGLLGGSLLACKTQTVSFSSTLCEEIP